MLSRYSIPEPRLLIASPRVSRRTAVSFSGPTGTSGTILLNLFLQGVPIGAGIVLGTLIGCAYYEPIARRWLKHNYVWKHKQ